MTLVPVDDVLQNNAVDSSTVALLEGCKTDRFWLMLGAFNLVCRCLVC